MMMCDTGQIPKLEIELEIWEAFKTNPVNRVNRKTKQKP